MDSFMVKIEGISVDELHIKLKTGKVEKLVKEVFGKDVEISEYVNILFVKEKQTIYDKVRMVPNPSFLNIFLSINKNRFELKTHNYFDKAKELAEKYETNFGGEVTLQTDYSKR